MHDTKERLSLFWIFALLQPACREFPGRGCAEE